MLGTRTLRAISTFPSVVASNRPGPTYFRRETPTGVDGTGRRTGSRERNRQRPKRDGPVSGSPLGRPSLGLNPARGKPHGPHGHGVGLLPGGSPDGRASPACGGLLHPGGADSGLPAPAAGVFRRQGDSTGEGTRLPSPWSSVWKPRIRVPIWQSPSPSWGSVRWLAFFRRSGPSGSIRRRPSRPTEEVPLTPVTSGGPHSIWAMSEEAGEGI